MTNSMFIKLYLISIPIFFIIDMLWLGIIANGFYQKHLGSLLSSNINRFAAIIFYLLFLTGLVFFAIMPAVKENSWVIALSYGAFFGLLTYATYDLTNLATLKDWPLIVVIVDIIRGMLLSGSVSVLTYFFAKFWGI